MDERKKPIEDPARPDDENETEFDKRDSDGDRDFGWEEGDPADRRRDPLRKP